MRHECVCTDNLIMIENCLDSIVLYYRSLEFKISLILFWLSGRDFISTFDIPNSKVKLISLANLNEYFDFCK